MRLGTQRVTARARSSAGNGRLNKVLKSLAHDKVGIRGWARDRLWIGSRSQGLVVRQDMVEPFAPLWRRNGEVVRKYIKSQGLQSVQGLNGDPGNGVPVVDCQYCEL